MATPPNKLSRFWQELKRRNVIRVVTVYAGAAFVMLELVDMITEPFGLPTWTLILAIVILSTGFIVAIILSWIYDVHPEGGIVRTEPAHKVEAVEIPKSLNSWKIASYISFVVIIVLVGFNILRNRSKIRIDESLPKSIAVLPFRNLSGDPGQDFICEGLTEEVINNLYKVEAFERIPSVTTVLNYKNTEKGLTEIADELQVNYILISSYKRMEGLIRFTVNLFEARSDRQVWHEDFDRETEKISAIPSNIALQIADHLKAFVTDSEKQRIQKISTSNEEAYLKYNQGNSYFRRGRNKLYLYTAIELYKESIAIDPRFALAYTSLARCYLNIYWFKYDYSQSILFESKKAIETALRIDPDLPEAYIAKAEYYYHGLLEYSNAIEQLEIASRYVSNHSAISLLTALVNRRMGKWEEAIKNFEIAYKIDPASSRITGNMAETYALTGDYQRAIDLFNKYLMIEPDNAELYSTKMHIYLMRDGNTQEAWKVIEEAAMNNITVNEVLVDAIYTPPFMLDVYDGDYQKALDFLSTTDWTGQLDVMQYYPKYMFQAMIYSLMDSPEKAVTYYDSTLMLLENNLMEFHEDPRILSSLGITYAGIGEKEKAIYYGQKAVDLYSLDRDAFLGLYRIEELAWIYVMVEEYDAAIEQLEILLNNPGSFTSAPLLILDPRWEPLRGHPEFMRIIEKYSK